MRSKSRLFGILVTTVVSTVLAGRLGAETVNCTAITSVPFTITVQGVYCLTEDLSTSMTSGVAIDVATNNVMT